jgi:hypothetical protein
VDLFDLVRVGAGFHSEPVSDPQADCTADGAIDLFDLVLVGSNYGLEGPQGWVDDRLAGTDSLAPGLGEAVVDGVVAEVVDQSAEQLVVHVTAHGIVDLYAAELRLTYDPELLRVVAASQRPGIQIAPGESWGGDGQYWVALNTVSEESGEIAFAASRVSPAPALTGDLQLATITFERLAADTDGTYGLTQVLLLAPTGEIGARWEGVDIFPTDTIVRAQQIFLPAARVERAGR